jgi:hypothetical protein
MQKLFVMIWVGGHQSLHLGQGSNIFKVPVQSYSHKGFCAFGDHAKSLPQKIMFPGIVCPISIKLRISQEL